VRAGNLRSLVFLLFGNLIEMFKADSHYMRSYAAGVGGYQWVGCGSNREPSTLSPGQ
jgi:hypothetical protein